MARHPLELVVRHWVLPCRIPAVCRRRQTAGIRHGSTQCRTTSSRGWRAMKDQESEDATVRGERDSSTLARAPSMQSRVSNLLAIGLMSVLGLGMLTWYYANAMTRQSHARASAQASAAKRAQSGDMPLPSLGRIDPPVAEKPPPQDLAPRAAAMSATPLREIPLETAPAVTGYGAAPPKTPAQLTLERQLSGAVFSQSST